MPNSAASSRRKILFSYVMRNALGAPGHGPRAAARRHLQRRGHHRAGLRLSRASASLLISAVHAGDYSLVLGITTVSIIAVSAAVLLIDLLYPLIDPRVETR